MNDLEIKIYPSEKMVKVPKLRIDIEECRWDSKTAVEILRETMTDDDNWDKIRAICAQLDKDDEEGWEATVESFNRVEQIEYMGDMLMGEDAEAEEFNTFIRNLEEAHEHIFFRHVHDIEFIAMT